MFPLACFLVLAGFLGCLGLFALAVTKVVAPDGRSAVKRQVRLGRRNSDFIEVIEGLDPGERVITSPYTGFAERDRLSLSGQ